MLVYYKHKWRLQMGERVQRTISLSVEENKKVNEVMETKKINLISIFRLGLNQAYAKFINKSARDGNHGK